jgi:chromate reductase
MTTPIHVLAFSGSLRRDSYNTATLRAAVELAPAGMIVDVVDIAAIPLFNADVESAGWPHQAVHLARRVAAADAVLLGCPEYNHSFTAVLKNALDWLSRTPPGAQPGQYVLARKPVAVIGASVGRSGSGRAQIALRQTLSYLDAYTLNQPEILIDHAMDKFDADGRLTDEPTRTVLAALMADFAAWIDRFGGSAPGVELLSAEAPTAHVCGAGQGPVYGVAGDNYTVKATAGQTGGAYAAFEFYVPPGGGPPPHTHEREYEGFYVLDGELTFYVGPDRSRVVARGGDFVAAPVGIIHQFRNESDAPARAFVIAAPAGVEEYFAAAGQPLPEGSTRTHPATDAEIARLTDLGPHWGIAIAAPATLEAS